MSNLTGFAALTLIGAGALSCAPLEESSLNASPPVSEFFCPSHEFLNCMPIVPRHRREFCTPEYALWIRDNCPNVEVVY